MAFLESQEEQEQRERQEHPETQALLVQLERRVMQETPAEMEGEDHLYVAHSVPLSQECGPQKKPSSPVEGDFR